MFSKLRSDFPILQPDEKKSLIYFDNAATTQKPQQVIDAISTFYAKDNANVARGIYKLGEVATDLYEQARAKVANFIGAWPEEVIFSSGTTRAINDIASSWGLQNIKSGDEILISELEHHSNLVPWQQLAKKTGAILKFIPVDKHGNLELNKLKELLTTKTKLVAVSHVSNALGTSNDIKKIIKEARKVGAKVLVDASQSIPHKKINVHDLDVDFLVFSAHKMLGPTGIGILYIKKDLHEQVPPFAFGGGMIFEVDFDKATFFVAPKKFEAGTPPIAQAIGFAGAIDYLQEHVDFDLLKDHESQLATQLIEGLQKIPKVKILGPIEQLKKEGSIVSFVIDGIHPHDIAEYLNQHGIAVRAGHHCAQPLAKKMGIDASVRVSFYFYNTKKEVEQFLQAIKKLVKSLP